MKRLSIFIVLIVGILLSGQVVAQDSKDATKDSPRPVVAVVQNVLKGVEKGTYSLVLKDVVMVFTIDDSTTFDGIPANVGMGEDGLRNMLRGRKVIVSWRPGKKGLFVAQKVELATESNVPKNAVIAKPAPVYRFINKDDAKIEPKRAKDETKTENRRFSLPQVNLPGGGR